MQRPRLCRPRGQVLLTLLMLAPAAQVAQAAAPGSEPGFTIAPYGWLAGLDGTVGAPGEGGDGGGNDRIDVMLDPDYELKGFMLYGEWRGERWMAFIDSVWANYQQGGTVKVADLLPGTDADAEVDGNIVMAAAGYRVQETDHSALVVFGGVRYYDLEVTLSAAGTLLPWIFDSTADESWTDAVVGAQWRYRFNRDWQGLLQADYGFGGSDSSWNLAATLGYGFSWGRVVGGWRHLAVDYETSVYKLDVALTGPLVGIVFDF